MRHQIIFRIPVIVGLLLFFFLAAPSDSRLFGAAAGDVPSEASHPTDKMQGRSIEDTVDFSGVEKFLELTAILEKDREPPKEMWDALFATPGYRILLIEEFKRDFFETRFRLAFMPSKSKELETQMSKEKGWIAQFLPHYIRARTERSEIMDMVSKIKNTAFVREAVDKALEWLPEFEVKSYPPISFVIFAPDARGYVPVVLDIFYTMERMEWLTEFVGHEFHHYYKEILAGLNGNVRWVIDQIHAEGIADQVNVGVWFRDKERYAIEAAKGRNKQYLNWYGQSPEILKKMNDIFERLADGTGDASKLGKELVGIVPQSGHPTGFYMANVILEQLGKKELVRDINSAPAFFRRYSQAALKSGSAPGFSDKALRYLDRYSH